MKYETTDVSEFKMQEILSEDELNFLVRHMDDRTPEWEKAAEALMKQQEIDVEDFYDGYTAALLLDNPNLYESNDDDRDDDNPDGDRTTNSPNEI